MIATEILQPCRSCGARRCAQRRVRAAARALVFVAMTLAAAPVSGACGDVNRDGRVKTVDALATLKAAVGQSVALDCGCTTDLTRPLCGDVDGDRTVTTSDALAVLRTAVGLRAGLACACDGPPNIVFIMTDDQDAGTLPYMPSVNTELVAKGASLVSAFATTSICCPSRATWLRGQYAHNHRVLSNAWPSGGFLKFHELGLEEETIAVWLQRAGYRTSMVGRYLNDYGVGDSARYIPPGWDEWFVWTHHVGLYFGARYNDNGTLVTYGPWPDGYRTDEEAEKAFESIERVASDPRPFFLAIMPFAPHDPATPPVRYETDFQGMTAPRSPSFNEEDVSDKPSFINQLAPLDELAIEAVDELYRNQLRSLQAVDDLLEEVLAALVRAGVADNTYVFFTSDQGFHRGEHRLPPGKARAYEEDIHIPLVVRGPGIEAGRTLDQLVVNADFAPTLAELAGAEGAPFVDGRSFVPLLAPASVPLAWRHAIPLEAWPAPPNDAEPSFRYWGVRTATRKLVRWSSAELELYDLIEDPFELESLHARSDPQEMAALLAAAARLRSCQADGCRAAEDQVP